MITPDKCIKCGGDPTIMTVFDCSYVQCSCGKWGPYEFMGARPDSAIRQWNVANASLYRKPGRRL